MQSPPHSHQLEGLPSLSSHVGLVLFHVCGHALLHDHRRGLWLQLGANPRPHFRQAVFLGWVVGRGDSIDLSHDILRSMDAEAGKELEGPTPAGIPGGIVRCASLRLGKKGKHIDAERGYGSTADTRHHDCDIPGLTPTKVEDMGGWCEADDQGAMVKDFGLSLFRKLPSHHHLYPKTILSDKIAPARRNDLPPRSLHRDFFIPGRKQPAVDQVR